MSFTKIGRFIAFTCVTFGLLGIAMGVGIAVMAGDMETNQILSRQYLGSVTSGESIDEGVYRVLVGVAFGIATEISQRLETLGNRA